MKERKNKKLSAMKTKMNMRVRYMKKSSPIRGHSPLPEGKKGGGGGAKGVSRPALFCYCG